MIKSIRNILLTIGITILFIGCGLISTNEPIVFENQIGLDGDILGTYELEAKDTVETHSFFIFYKNSKYYFYYTGDSKRSAGRAGGSFLPSKVDNTKDYYIMSFPIFVLKEYIHEDKRLNTEITNNALLFFKKEQNKLIFWYDLINDKKEDTLSITKEKIISSYKQTFIKDPLLIINKIKDVNLNTSTQSKIFFKKIEKKYAHYQEKKD